MSQQVLIWCCFLLLVDLVYALTGDNVCRRLETSSETVEYVVQEPVTYRLYTWCLKMPPRCSKYTTVMKEKIKSKLQVNNHTIEFCCDGYVEITNFCVPECNSTDCPNMKCDENRKCNCLAGYTGSRCHRTCRSGLWGENCAHKCVCNGNPCDLITGDCTHTTTPAPLFPTTIPYFNNKDNIETKPSSQQFTPSSTLRPQLSPSYSTASITYVTKKSEKTEISQEIADSVDPTTIPAGLMPEDVLITLLPDDEVIIVYPSTSSSTTESLKPITSSISPLPTEKITSSTERMSTSTNAIEKYITPNSIASPTSGSTSEKPDLRSTVNYLSKIPEMNIDNKNELIDGVGTKEPERRNTSVPLENKKYDKKRVKSTESPSLKKYGTMSIPKQEGNGLPPPVYDTFGNTLQINNGRRNFSTGERTIALPDDIQRDMGSSNLNNFSTVDITVNGSLVKAKWHSSMELVDFSSVSIFISLSAVVLLSVALIIASVVQCRKVKTDPTVYESRITCENSARTAHYATPGQPIFFCPAFSNSYAFELAQELREANYDHPRSARCLNNEPVYAELRY